MFRLGDPLDSLARDCEDVAITRADRMDPPSRERAGTSELSRIPRQPTGRKCALLMAQRPSSLVLLRVPCLGARSWVCQCSRPSVHKVELKRIELFVSG